MKHVKTYSKYDTVNENLKKPIYKTVIRVEILSDDEIGVDGMSLSDIGYEIDEGGWSGRIETVVENQKLSGKNAVKAIEKQGSDPSFFGMDDAGNELD